MKDYHISGMEFPGDGETAKEHKLVLDMDKPSIFTLTKGSSAPRKTTSGPKFLELWKRHSLILSIVFLALFILALVALLVLILVRVFE
ncbi:unnamed protein product [Cylicocyclus nassatus]|uniref:Uncharacterized protein n=1 Tax=Cylicocyclus nassatus TaxID=53992 RepID=A0AA36MDH7_CYLNA|nr:unnamed protein product [Cylicocyclus nassatus]